MKRGIILKSKKFTAALLIIQLLLSVLMAGLVFKLNILPTKYVAAFLAVLALFILILFVINHRIKKGKKARLFLDIVIILINISLLLGNYYFYRSYSALAQPYGWQQHPDPHPGSSCP